MANANNPAGSKKKTLLEKLRDRDYPEIKKDIDEGIYDNVVEPMAKAGYENAGPAIGAGLSAANEFFVPGSDTETAMLAAGPVVGKLGKLAKPAARAAEEVAETIPKLFNLEQLKGLLSPKAYAKAAEDVRLTGSHTMFGPKGEIVGTVGEFSEAGKGLMADAKAAKTAEMAAAPTFDYSKFDDTVRSAEKATRAPRVSGEAAEFMQRTGVDPTRKTALQTLPELQKKSKKEQEEALAKLRNPFGED